MIKRISKVLAQLGFILLTAQNIFNINRLLEENFWTILVVAFVVLIITNWPDPVKRKPGFREDEKIGSIRSLFIRYKWIIVIIVIFLILAGHRYHLQHRTKIDNEPIITPEDLSFMDDIIHSWVNMSFTEACANEKQDEKPLLVQFELHPLKTSYEERDEDKYFHYTPRGEDNLVPLDLENYEFRYDGSNCRTYFRDESTLEALKRMIKKSERYELLKYIENKDLLYTLRTRLPDVVRKIIPKKDDWKYVESEKDRDLIWGWMRECIGIPFPVFVFTIENRNLSRNLVITGIRYHIIDMIVDREISHYSGKFGTIESNAKYYHYLKKVNINSDAYSTFDYHPQNKNVLNYFEHAHVGHIDYENESFKIPRPQMFSLIPAFYIEPGAVGSFELCISVEDLKENDMHLIMSIELMTNQGTNIHTPEFIWTAIPLNTKKKFPQKGN